MAVLSATTALVLVAALGVLPGAQAAPTDGVRREVQLTVLGRFPGDLLSAIERGLHEELQVRVHATRRHGLPRSAYYPPRKRYRAEKLLDFMLRRAPQQNQLGLTSVDISTTKGKHRDWGIFGLALLSDRVAVISTHRLHRQARDEAHFRFRVVSTAVHEVGHMLGLNHCTEHRCVMNDAHGSIRTVDRSTGRLGPACRRELERRSPL